MRARPVSHREARRYVGEHHRHSRPPTGALFVVGCEDDAGELRGVAIVGRPMARMLADGFTVEITRVCTDGYEHACSFLYGRACAAAKALGYRRAFTYTLASEPGTSARAAGFVEDGAVKAQTWNRTSRHRYSHDIFGEPMTPQEDKKRWLRVLAS